MFLLTQILLIMAHRAQNWRAPGVQLYVLVIKQPAWNCRLLAQDLAVDSQECPGGTSKIQIIPILPAVHM